MNARRHMIGEIVLLSIQSATFLPIRLKRDCTERKNESKRASTLEIPSRKQYAARPTGESRGRAKVLTLFIAVIRKAHSAHGDADV